MSTKGKIVFLMIFTSSLGGIFFWCLSQEKRKTIFEAQPALPMEKVEEKSSSESLEGESILEKEEKPDGVGVVNTGLKEPLAEEEKNIDSDKSMVEGNESKSFSLKQALVSFGYEKGINRKIDTVVLHSSYNPNGDPYSVSAVRSIWQSYGVAPHYMVARDGIVYQLVADKDIAYHAGEGKMKDGRTSINNFSIGVEILNTKDDEYTKAQYKAVSDLIAYLKKKYSIKYVVGHDDIAPGRKTDPWNFDWDKI